MVQFKVTRLLGLRVQLDGVAVVNENGFQLTFNDPEHAHQLWQAECETVLVPWPEVESWEVDYGLLGHRLRIKIKDVSMFGSLPGIDDKQLELDVRKQERESLEDLEKRAKDYQAGRRKDNVDDLLDDIRGFLYDQNE